MFYVCYNRIKFFTAHEHSSILIRSLIRLKTFSTCTHSFSEPKPLQDPRSISEDDQDWNCISAGVTLLDCSILLQVTKRKKSIRKYHKTWEWESGVVLHRFNLREMVMNCPPLRITPQGNSRQRAAFLQRALTHESLLMSSAPQRAPLNLLMFRHPPQAPDHSLEQEPRAATAAA